MTVELGITPTTVHIDPEENFIFIRTSLLGKNLLLGAIYGPNNTSRDFYRRISAILELYTNCSIIIGGDWNTVLDQSPVGNNIDIFKMASIPNPKNSELLRKMVVEYELSDPFRVLHPSVHSFTYSPFGLMRKNRSRLDFLLISQNNLPSLLDCEISSAPAIGLFDHKSVTLKLGQFKKKVKNTIPKLRNSGLSDILLQHTVTLAAYSVNYHSLDTTHIHNNLGQIDTLKNSLKNDIAIIRELIADLLNLRTLEAENGESNLLGMQIAGKNAEIKLKLDTMIPLAELSEVPKNCTPCRFFEVIAEQTREQGIKIQKKLHT